MKNRGTRGNGHQALSVDNPKKGGLGNEMGNSLFNGHPRMPIPSAGERYPHQNGFWPFPKSILAERKWKCWIRPALPVF